MTIKQQERNARNHLEQYTRSYARSLDDVYGRYSRAKENAWNYCIDLCIRLDGYNLRVISYNQNIFTAGFLFNDKETGVLKFMYITPNYDVEIEV